MITELQAQGIVIYQAPQLTWKQCQDTTVKADVDASMTEIKIRRHRGVIVISYNAVFI